MATRIVVGNQILFLGSQKHVRGNSFRVETKFVSSPKIYYRVNPLYGQQNSHCVVDEESRFTATQFVADKNLILRQKVEWPLKDSFFSVEKTLIVKKITVLEFNFSSQTRDGRTLRNNFVDLSFKEITMEKQIFVCRNAFDV